MIRNGQAVTLQNGWKAALNGCSMGGAYRYVVRRIRCHAWQKCKNVGRNVCGRCI